MGQKLKKWINTDSSILRLLILVLTISASLIVLIAIGIPSSFLEPNEAAGAPELLHAMLVLLIIAGLGLALVVVLSDSIGNFSDEYGCYTHSDREFLAILFFFLGLALLLVSILSLCLYIYFIIKKIL